MARSLLNATLGLFLGVFVIFSAAAQEQSPLGAQTPTNADQTAIPAENAESELDNAVEPSELPFTIVGFGDSLMAGYRLSADQSFTAQLETALRDKGYDVVINNAGVSGDTTTGGKTRIDWSVPDGTNLVILELGANDMLRGITPDITYQNLDFMLQRLKERNIPVLLVGMQAAPNYGASYAEQFNPIYSKLAKQYQLPLYPLFVDGVAANPDYLLDDGAHPNEKGIKVMVERFLPTIETVLQSFNIKPSKE